MRKNSPANLFLRFFFFFAHLFKILFILLRSRGILLFIMLYASLPLFLFFSPLSEVNSNLTIYLPKLPCTVFHRKEEFQCCGTQFLRTKEFQTLLHYFNVGYQAINFRLQRFPKVPTTMKFFPPNFAFFFVVSFFFSLYFLQLKLS